MFIMENGLKQRRLHELQKDAEGLNSKSRELA